MRLATLNLLKCTRKDLERDGELRLEPTKIEMRSSEFDTEFLVHVLPTLDWTCLREYAGAVGVTSLPEELEEANRSDEAFLRALHHVLFDIHVMEGRLVCKESGQVFRIENGTANMMIPEELAA